MSTAFPARALKFRHALDSINRCPLNYTRDFIASSASNNAAVNATKDIGFFSPAEPKRPSVSAARTSRHPASHFLEDPSGEYKFRKNKWLVLARRKRGEGAKVQPPDEAAANLLLRLVAKGDLSGADAAKLHYDRDGIRIMPKAGFANAAMKALEISIPQDRMRHFMLWWSLVPVKDCAERFDLLDRKLLDHPFDLLAHAHFCLHSIRQGLVHEVQSSHVLRHIFRFGTSNATTALLHKIEKEVKKQIPLDQETYMSFRRLAVRMHLLASRRQHAAHLYYATDGAMDIDEAMKTAIAHDGRGERLDGNIRVHTASTRRFLPRSESPADVNLISELRTLRRIITCKNNPPNFEPFLADFLYAYSRLRKTGKAPQLLRRMVFSRPSSAVRMRWVGGELTLYSSTSKPIACLKTYLHYCLADNLLAVEARRILREFQENPDRKLDSHLANTLPRIGWKLWPNSLLVSTTWKAVLMLSKSEDLERLYKQHLEFAEAASLQSQHREDEMQTEPGENVLGIPEIYYRKLARAATSPLVFPGPSLFHHFIVAFATRVAPRRAAEIIVDMQRLGLRPKKRTWGALAGAYARSGDMNRVMRILDHIDSFDLGTQDVMNRSAPEKKVIPRLAVKTSIMAYNSVLRGLTECGMYAETHTIQERMRERSLVSSEVDRRTKAILHRRSRYEKDKPASFYRKQFLRRRSLKVDGRHLRIDEKRVDWVGSERS